MLIQDRLRELQGEKTQSEFAAEIGIDQSTLSRLMRGEIALGRRTAQMLCRRFPELSLEIASFLLRGDMHRINGDAA